MPAFAATDTSTFHTIEYTQVQELQVGERIAITGTPNYSAATNNSECNFFGFDTADGVWYIAIGKTSVAAFQAAVPAQQITLYGMYAGTLDANGMPILDIQSGAISVFDVLSEASDTFSAGKQKLAETATAEKAKTEAAANQSTQTVASEPTSGEVWIPRTGKRYHSSPTCSNMKNPSKVGLAEAKRRGYTPCKKCY